MQKNQTTTFAEKVDETFYDNTEGLTPDKYDNLTSMIPDAETLASILPSIKERMDNFKKMEEECDTTAKENNTAKKMWKSRQEQMLALLGHIMKAFGKKSCSNGELKAAITTRETLSIDEDSFLDMYRNKPEFKIFCDTFLPKYIKVSLSIDKNALKAYLKTDDSLVRTYPEIVHPDQKTSVTLK